jgi:hypothetical protein
MLLTKENLRVMMWVGCGRKQLLSIESTDPELAGKV